MSILLPLQFVLCGTRSLLYSSFLLSRFRHSRVNASSFPVVVSHLLHVFRLRCHPLNNPHAMLFSSSSSPISNWSIPPKSCCLFFSHAEQSLSSVIALWNPAGLYGEALFLLISQHTFRRYDVIVLTFSLTTSVLLTIA